MTSEITLYRADITPEMNYGFDDIEVFLASKSQYVIPRFQYVKNGLDISIKIEMPQDSINYRTYDYVKIKNDFEAPVYYFITNQTWRSEYTGELTLSIDSINTFTDFWTVKMTNKTKVIREHKDRFVKIDNKIFKKVDRESEGIAGINLIRKSNTRLEDDNPNVRGHWYLAYQSSISGESESGIQCSLVPLREDIVVGRNELDNAVWSVKVSSMAYDTVYFIDSSVCKSVTGAKGYNYKWTTAGQTGIMFWKVRATTGTKNVIYFRFIGYRSDDTIYSHWTTGEHKNTSETNELIFEDVSSYWYRTQSNLSPTFDIPSQNTITRSNFLATFTSTAYTPSPLAILDNINNWNKADSRLVKIIECPYCPADVTKQGSNYVPPSGFVQGSEDDLLRWTLYDTAQKFERANFITIDPSLQVFLPSNLDIHKNINYETKLLHSDFYTYKFNYDNFNVSIRYESIIDPTNIITVSYIQSNNISSKFLFDIKYLGDYEYISDYESMMVCTRNNELSIFNNEYLNYIKTGYNYDVKTKNRQVAQSWVNTGISVAGTVAAGVAGAATGNPFAVSSAVTMGASAVNSVANNIFNQVQAEQDLKQKLDVLANQSTSVSGADDLSLLNYYNNNALWLTTYEPTAKMKDTLFDLFYYCGYATNETKVPDLYTRRYFNYIQCEADFDYEAGNTLFKYIDDIKARLYNGVTLFHRYDDMHQEKENWETWIA